MAARWASLINFWLVIVNELFIMIGSSGISIEEKIFSFFDWPENRFCLNVPLI
jgi:hypothetical protein